MCSDFVTRFRILSHQLWGGGIRYSPKLGGATMSKLRLFLFVIAVFGCVGLTSSAALACSCYEVDTDQDPTPCIGKNECNSEYYAEFCSWGCIQGECGISGYGLCCGTQFKNYSVTPQSCWDPPHGCSECGQARERGLAHAALPRAKKEVGETTRERIGLLRDGPSEEVLFVPDRCRHTYGTIFPGERLPPEDSSARSEMPDVRPGGGI